MLFNSVEYVLLLAAAFTLYWTTTNQPFRLVVLLLASFVFYASWEPMLLILLIGAIAGNFYLVLSRLIGMSTGVAIIVAANLLVLGYYKYTNFLVSVASDLMQTLGLDGFSSSFSIVLPIGISFFTFQLIAYVIDVRRGIVEKETSLLRFGVFISFFPQLIAGPICRANQFLPQLRELKAFDGGRIAQGMLMIGVGLFLKTGIADNLAPYVDSVYSSPGDAGSTAATLATVAFGVQILCDFWGYSTIALGSAHLFGYSIPSNFDLPYVSASLQSFWRRWHITLSFWLRDYLYISLGGNRLSAVRTYVNLIIVMGLGGLWHGASYNFIIWGLIHGGVLAVERFFGNLLRGRPRLLPTPIRLLLGWFYTMVVVFVAWIFFRAEDLPTAIDVLATIMIFDLESLDSQTGWEAFGFVVLFAVTMVPLHMLNEAGSNMNFYRHPEVPGNLQPAPLEGAIAVRDGALVLPRVLKLVIAFWLVLAGVILGSGEAVPFIYFQF